MNWSNPLLYLIGALILFIFILLMLAYSGALTPVNKPVKKERDPHGFYREDMDGPETVPNELK